MNMTNASAMARARSMIEVIRQSLVPGLAERNAAMADKYALALLECGLIERTQYEELAIEAQMELSRWRVTLGLHRHP